MFDEYMKYVAGPYKQLMDEQKKAGIIVDWSVYTVVPQGPHDPDLYLITTYKNMAALDGLNEKTDPEHGEGLRLDGQVERRRGRSRKDSQADG